MGLYRSALRPLLFAGDAEAMHERAMHAAQRASASARLCNAVRAWRTYTSPRLLTTVAGLQFANPLGLAAGFDKSGRGVAFLGSLGFGHVEIGSVSSERSDGNPRPRLFRLPDERAIVVNYGLPNDGADAVAARLATRKCPVPLGINVVSTNRGAAAAPDSEDEVIADYVHAAQRLVAYADYLVLNLSCPNTPDGRGFFIEPSRLARLLAQLEAAAIAKPLFLKVAPFADAAALDAFYAVAADSPIVRGFSINLPPGKPMPLAAPSDVLARMPGAVAGRPAAALTDDAIATLYRRIDRTRHCIIGSGGIFTAEDAYRKIRLGASLVQVLTALIYEGPAIPTRLAAGLDRLLARDGYAHVAEAVGASERGGRA